MENVNEKPVRWPVSFLECSHKMTHKVIIKVTYKVTHKINIVLYDNMSIMIKEGESSEINKILSITEKYISEFLFPLLPNKVVR